MPNHLRTLYEEQNKRCYWCPRLVFIPKSKMQKRHFHPKNRATLDHIIPKCEGGPDSLDNLVMACLECNNRRGSLPAEVFGRMMWGAAVSPAPQAPP